MNDTSLQWLSLDWFTPATLRAFTWQWPEFLYLIPAVVVLFIVRWLLRRRFNQKLPIATVKRDLRSSAANLLRLVPEILLMLVLALLLVALARPQRTNEMVEQWTEGIDIMLALDISQSMQIEDFTPNRLEAAKRVAREFIEGRSQDRIGIVVFSGDAFSLAPLTTDYDLLKQYLNEISYDIEGMHPTFRRRQQCRQYRPAYGSGAGIRLWRAHLYHRCGKRRPGAHGKRFLWQAANVSQYRR
jgi:Ca-activated chloride channel family protein